MELFEESTHCKFWLMTREEMLSRRESAVSASISEELAHPPMKRKLEETKDSDLRSILHEDEAVLCRYSAIIQHYFGDSAHSSTDSTRGPTPKHWRVASTAIVFLRRFYLNNSLTQHDPRLIL